MENIRNKINSKRIEEIELEKNFLKDLISDFKEKKVEHQKKIEMNDLEIEIMGNILKTLNKKNDIDINTKIEKNDEDIKKNIETIKNIEIELLNNNNQLSKELKVLDEKLNLLRVEEKDFEGIIENKDKKIDIYRIRLRELNLKYDELSNLIKNIVVREKEYKNKINDASLKAVVERYNIIQETANNLIQKKRFEKEKKRLEKNLVNFEIEHSKIKNNRKELRLKMENDYLNSLNSENAIELIESRNILFKDYDSETRKIIFFSENKIKALKNKLKMGEDFLNLNHQRKVKEKNQINYEINEKLKNFHKDKKDLERQREDVKNDIIFIENSISLQNIETKKIYDSGNTELKEKFSNIEKLRAKLKLENEEKLKNNQKLIQELTENNVFLNKNVESIKNKYYSDKKISEERKNKIKSDMKKTNQEKTKLHDFFKDYQNKYYIEKKNIEERIEYLNKKLNK